MKIFKIRLKTLGLATVGWSHPVVAKADIVLARKYNYRGGYTVYIPGSSFKGALRSSASRIAEAYGFASCGETLPGRLHPLDSSEVGFDTCSVCHVFGYPGRGSSKIYVDDLEPEDEEVMTYRVTYVGLDDHTLTRSEHKLYTVEVIPPDTVFRGSIEIEDSLGREAVKLLMLALAELRLGRFGKNAAIDLMIAEGLDPLKEMLGGEAARYLEGLGRWVWG